MYIKIVIGDFKKVENNENGRQPLSEVLVNPDCPIRIIYDFIQKSFDIDCELEFDLCDETGNLAFIYDKEPWINGTNYLKPKTTYFVVLFERDEENRIINPMLHIPDAFRKSPGQINDLMNKIKKQLNPSLSNKPSKTSKTRLITSSYAK